MSQAGRDTAQAGDESARFGIKSGVNFVTIARLESEMSDPRLSTLRALAKALNVKVTELIDE